MHDVTITVLMIVDCRGNTPLVKKPSGTKRFQVAPHIYWLNVVQCGDFSLMLKKYYSAPH